MQGTTGREPFLSVFLSDERRGRGGGERAGAGRLLHDLDVSVWPPHRFRDARPASPAAGRRRGGEGRPGRARLPEPGSPLAAPPPPGTCEPPAPRPGSGGGGAARAAAAAAAASRARNRPRQPRGDRPRRLSSGPFKWLPPTRVHL